MGLSQAHQCFLFLIVFIVHSTFCLDAKGGAKRSRRPMLRMRSAGRRSPRVTHAGLMQSSLLYTGFSSSSRPALHSTRYTGAVFPHIKPQSVVQIDGRGIRRHSGHALGRRGGRRRAEGRRKGKAGEELGVRNWELGKVNLFFNGAQSPWLNVLRSKRLVQRLIPLVVL
jgi:hypothetical protein